MTSILDPDAPGGSALVGPLPALIFLVSTDRDTLHRMEALLTQQGHLVSAAASFSAARDLLRSARPDLLIADLRLEAFNGLHLAIYGRALFPQLRVIITNDEPSDAFQADAAKLGAMFFPRSLGDEAFLELLQSVLANRRVETSRIRQWPRKRTSSVVEARIAGASAQVVDVSYGGLRLAFDIEPDVPDVFDLTVPSANVTLRAHRVWTTRSASAEAEVWCGVAVAPGELPPPAWLEFVDAVS
ncbi:MAG TPA: response regulator [Vicinamibacterales bacterium]|nr:response regulator [Vicinamibacterales bacterium]